MIRLASLSLRMADIKVSRLENPERSYRPYLLMQEMSVRDTDVFSGMINQLCLVASRSGKIDEQEVNFLVGFLQRNFKPQNHDEMLLCGLMAVTYKSVMKAAERLNNTQTLADQDIAQRIFNRLARSYIDQAQTLKSLRVGVQPSVTVNNNLSVNEGGQAVAAFNVTPAAPAIPPPPANNGLNPPPTASQADKRPLPEPEEK